VRLSSLKGGRTTAWRKKKEHVAEEKIVQQVRLKSVMHPAREPTQGKKRSGRMDWLEKSTEEPALLSPNNIHPNTWIKMSQEQNETIPTKHAT